MKLFRTSLLVLLFSIASFAQVTRYADVNAAPGGTGSQAQPFTSIQAAVNSLPVTGGTVIVAPGTYFEHAINTNGNPLTLIAPGGPEQTIIDAQGNNRGITGGSNGITTVKIDGFRIRNAAQYGVLLNSCEDIEITRCFVEASFSIINAVQLNFPGAVLIRDSILAVQNSSPAAVSINNGINCNLRMRNCHTRQGVYSVRASNGFLGSLDIRSSILASPLAASVFASVAQPSTISYCNQGQAPAVAGATLTAVGNVNQDAMFFNPLSNDFRFFPESVSANSGDPMAQPGVDGVGLVDFYGNPRLVGRIEQGPFEIQPKRGSGEDFEMTALIDGQASAAGIPVSGGEIMTLTLNSPNGAFNGTIPLLLVDAFATGFDSIGPAPFSDILHFQIASVQQVYGPTNFLPSPALPAAGQSFTVSLPGGLTNGTTLLLQSLAVTPSAANGFFAASDALELRY